MRFELRSLRSESSTVPLNHRYQWLLLFTQFSGLSWVVTVTIFKTSRHSKLLFFVKNKGQWNAKSGPKVGDGKLLCEKNVRDVWCRNESLRAEIGQKLVNFCTHTQVTVTVFKTSRHSKLLFFVKNKGQCNAKSGPKVGDGKVAM